jgi:hypothetical protein
MAIIMLLVLSWVLAPCDTEDGDSMFPQYIGSDLQYHVVPKSKTSTL